MCILRWIAVGISLGDAETYFQNAKKKINIDHHISNSGCGDVNLVRPEVGSACEVLYHIMDAELIDRGYCGSTVYRHHP